MLFSARLPLKRTRGWIWEQDRAWRLNRLRKARADTASDDRGVKNNNAEFYGGTSCSRRPHSHLETIQTIISFTIHRAGGFIPLLIYMYLFQRSTQSSSLAQYSAARAPLPSSAAPAPRQRYSLTPLPSTSYAALPNSPQPP